MAMTRAQERAADRPGAVVVPLSAVGAGMLDTVGGKAANLGELIGAGFAVPDGFVVTTEAYRAVAGPVDELIGRWDGPELAVRARAVVLAAEVPAGVAAAVRDGYRALGEDAAVAVRSSATAEDLPYASFAGQQDSYLHVVGVDRVVDAVRRCWASLWTDRAVAYRAATGIDHGQVRLAVVVQRMVDAVAAGVLFTADPVTGRRRQAVIDASPGLGEAVVSGAVNPDRFTVDTRAGRVLARRLGDKRTAVRPTAGGGTHTVALPDGSAAPCLTEEQVSALTAVGERVEAHFGVPQDIEWAIDAAGAVWLTQARPITTLYPLPVTAPVAASATTPATAPGAVSVEDELRVYFNVNVAQGMYRPFTPMGLAAFRLIGAGVAQLAGRPVADRRAGPPVLTAAGGRLFVELTAAVRSTLGRQVVPRIFDVMEARSAVMVRSLFDDPRLSIVYGPGPVLRAIARIAVRCRIPLILLRVLVTPGFARRHLAALRAGLTTGLDLPADAIPADHLRMAERILTERMPVLPPSVLPLLLVGMGSFVLTGKLQPDADPALREAVLRSMPHNVTTEMDLRLWTLACAIRHDPAAAAELTDTAPATLAARYHAGTLATGTQRGLAGFLAEYGIRAVAEIDLGVPRWSEDPTHLFGVLANYLRLSGQRLAPDIQFAQGAVAAEAAIDELVRQARHRGRIRAGLVRFGLRRARQLIGYRESPKFLLVTALARARQHIGEVGRALTASGALSSADEVFFLDFAEAERALAGSGEDFHAVVAGRRDDYQRELRRRVLPRILLSDGTEPTPDGAARELPGGALAGTPASRGTVTGVARVVLEPIGAQLEPGEILVAPSTDPGWTPLFLTAGDLVMEMGGANSHGAMVAREYGIPAVVGVPDATHKIATGERITVDGAAGTVMIDKPAD